MKTGQEILLERYYGKLAELLLTKKESDERGRRELIFLMICSLKAIGDFSAANDLDNAYKDMFGVSCTEECCQRTSMSIAI